MTLKDQEIAILEALKEKLRKTKILDDDKFGSKRWDGKSEKSKYYLFDKRNNLFEAERGVKLGTGVESIRSSAAMIFNLMGKDTVEFNDGSQYDIQYEEEFEVIEDEKAKTHSAHLDVTLRNEKKSEMIAIEAKMREWLNSPKNLAKAYLEEKSYPKENDKKKKFISFFNGLVDKGKELKYGRHPHTKYKVYDAIQMTIHILSLYNECCKSHYKSITLCNVVWKYDCSRYNQEEEEGQKFVEEANKEFSHIFKEKGVDFKVEYITFQYFKERLKLSDDRKSYLQRYEIKSTRFA